MHDPDPQNLRNRLEAIRSRRAGCRPEDADAVNEADAEIAAIEEELERLDLEEQTMSKERERPPVPAHRAETGGMNGRNRTPEEVIEDLEFNTWDLVGESRRQALEIIGWLKELRVMKLRARSAEALARSAGVPIGLPENITRREDLTGVLLSRKPAAHRPLTISAEEYALRTFLKTLVTAGYNIQILDEARDGFIDVDIDAAVASLHSEKVRAIDVQRFDWSSGECELSSFTIYGRL